ncbi:MAG: hypothetical protein QOH36_1400 [Actinomycetota bacterium]|nr:hypothetical protein [Actinomycetota bacterium]
MISTPTLRNAMPPPAVLAVLNPVMRVVLRSPLGRLMKPLALLEFTGRRSGLRYRVPAGWHQAVGAPVVLTPAPWRANFAGGAAVSVYHRGRKQAMTATLVTDPDVVASAVRAMLADGTPPRAIGLKIPAGHTVTAADVTSVDRAMIRFRSRCDGGRAPVRARGRLRG